MIVEDQNGWQSEAGKKLPEPAPCKAGCIVRVVWGQQWQRQAMRREAHCRLAQIKEVSGKIGVSCVQLVPQPSDTSCLHVAGYERGLPGTGRTGDPDHGMLTQCIQPRK